MTVLAFPPSTLDPQRNPAAYYLMRGAEGSHSTQRWALNKVAAIVGRTMVDMPWGELRYESMVMIRLKIEKMPIAPATRNLLLYAVRGVLREAWRLRLISHEEFIRALDGAPAFKGERVRIRTYLYQGARDDLFAACDVTKPSGARDAALLGILYYAGLRRAGAAHLDLIERGGMKRGLYVEKDAEIFVIEKGDKERVVPAPAPLVQHLATWLDHRGREAGPLFLPVTKYESILWENFSGVAVYLVCQRLAERAGVPRFHPHDLRGTYASDLFYKGVDITTVQKLMGHANINTTASYDLRGKDVMREAAERLGE